MLTAGLAAAPNCLAGPRHSCPASPRHGRRADPGHSHPADQRTSFTHRNPMSELFPAGGDGVGVPQHTLLQRNKALAAEQLWQRNIEGQAANHVAFIGARRRQTIGPQKPFLESSRGHGKVKNRVTTTDRL